jgi:hypothetical protein
MKKQILLVATVLLVAASAFGQATAVNTNTVSATLAISATIQSAVFLNLQTGTTAGIGHCTIAGGAGGAFTMNFQNVDGLGINNSCGVGASNKFAPATPGQTAATYFTDYNIIPAWAGLTETTGTITAKLGAATPTGTSLVVPTVVDTNTTPGSAAAFGTTLTTTATPVVSASASTGLGQANADGSTFTRFIGLTVSPTATTGNNLPIATVTFTLTVQ